MASRYSTAGLSKNLTYTIAEIHDIRGTSPQTIRGYIKNEGLCAMISQKPWLIHGADYVEFLQKKRNKGKQPLKPGEVKCFTCGHRGRPMGDLADLIKEGNRRRLIALCGTCEEAVSLYISEAKLVQYREVLDIAEGSTL